MTDNSDRLSLADVFAVPVFTDWSERAAAVEDPDEAPRPVLPYPTRAALADYDADALARFDETEDEDDRADILDEFETGDGGADWADSFWPAMNFAYPLTLAHDADPREVAGAIEAAAGCVSLVDMGEDWRGESSYALALTGGGMDLSAHICAAYVAAGNVPPAHFLRDLPRYADRGHGLDLRPGTARAVLRGALRCADYLHVIASRIDEDASRRLSEGAVPEAGEPVAREG